MVCSDNNFYIVIIHANTPHVLNPILKLMNSVPHFTTSESTSDTWHGSKRMHYEVQKQTTINNANLQIYCNQKEENVSLNRAILFQKPQMRLSISLCSCSVMPALV